MRPDGDAEGQCRPRSKGRLTARCPVILTNTLGRPWKAGVNGSSFEKVRDAALPGRDLHFHDLRGTAATRFHLAGLSNRDIAEIMARDEASVEKIIRRYVGRKAVTAGIIKRLNQTEEERSLQNLLQNHEPKTAKCWSGRRESNPHEKLGKLSGYHYITPAEARGNLTIMAAGSRAELRSRR